MPRRTKVNDLASTALPAPEIAPRAAPGPEAAAAPSLSVRVLDWPCCGAPSIVSRWDVLARTASEPNPFLESWYLLPALRALDPQETVRIILVEGGDEIVGLMPLANEKRYYRRPIPTSPAGLTPTPSSAPR
jgi:hypothetical protein